MIKFISTWAERASIPVLLPLMVSSWILNLIRRSPDNSLRAWWGSAVFTWKHAGKAAGVFDVRYAVMVIASLCLWFLAWVGISGGLRYLDTHSAQSTVHEVPVDRDE